jgi:solute carrier family 30 (zinc transporter), member 2
MVVIVNFSRMFFVLHANVCGNALPHHGHSHGDGNHGHSHGSNHHEHSHDEHNTRDASVINLVSNDDQENLAPVKQRTENINVRAAIIHVIGDFVQSVGVLCAAILIKLKVSNEHKVLEIEIKSFNNHLARV